MTFPSSIPLPCSLSDSCYLKENLLKTAISFFPPHPSPFVSRVSLFPTDCPLPITRPLCLPTCLPVHLPSFLFPHISTHHSLQPKQLCSCFPLSLLMDSFFAIHDFLTLHITLASFQGEVHTKWIIFQSCS